MKQGDKSHRVRLIHGICKGESSAGQSCWLSMAHASSLGKRSPWRLIGSVCSPTAVPAQQHHPQDRLFVGDSGSKQTSHPFRGLITARASAYMLRTALSFKMKLE